jgi:hypothetical protein
VRGVQGVICAAIACWGAGSYRKKKSKSRKEQKRHRDVFSFSSERVRSLLALNQPNAGAATS